MVSKKSVAMKPLEDINQQRTFSQINFEPVLLARECLAIYQIRSSSNGIVLKADFESYTSFL